MNFYIVFVLLFVLVNDTCADSHSCRRRCNARYNPEQPCQCNTQCVSKGDWCTDYELVCQGANISDEDLIEISGQLWDADENDRINVRLSLQGKTEDGSTTDKAPDLLFSEIPTEFETNPIYATQIALYDYYIPNENVPEPQSDARIQKIDDFLDTVMDTDVMNKMHEFLASKGVVPSDENDFKELLHDIWYSMYRRCGALSSSGGEHVQMGETKTDDDIDGFHSWVRFALLERRNEVNYLGYVRVMDLNGAYVIRNPFYWSEYFKPIGGFFIGTSPAFEMSVYTLCFYARPDSICNLRFNGYDVPIQTYTMDYDGKVLVGSSYPNY